TYTYAVEWVQDYDVAELTPEAIRDIVGQTDYRALTLITCGGEFDPESGEYLSRTIVRARLIDANVSAASADAAGTVSAPDTSAPEGITGAANDTGSVEDAPVEAIVPDQAEAADTTAQLAVGNVATVTENGLNMRASASTSADIVITLAQGHQATIIGGPQDADGFAWWQIELEDGTQGWVAADFLQP
nr:SH3 domain-containing protein [Chloroflexia bacterium]